MASQFGIDFYTIAQPYWSASSTSNPDQMLNDAIINHGKGSADFMIAFSAAIFDTSQKIYFGASKLNYPYVIIFDHKYSQNCKTTQHEIGHTYGIADHCETTCVMSLGWDEEWKVFEHLCSSHRSQWSSAKNKY